MICGPNDRNILAVLVLSLRSANLMKIKKFLFVARCFPTIWEVFTQKFSSNVCSWKLLLFQHDQTKSIFVLSILIAKFTVKCCLFVLSKKLSQYCDCVYPVFLTKTCGLSHGISLWDWVLGGTGRKAPISMWFPIAKLPKCSNSNDKETIPKASEKVFVIF